MKKNVKSLLRLKKPVIALLDDNEPDILLTGPGGGWGVVIIPKTSRISMIHVCLGLASGEGGYYDGLTIWETVDLPKDTPSSTVAEIAASFFVRLAEYIPAHPPPAHPLPDGEDQSAVRSFLAAFLERYPDIAEIAANMAEGEISSWITE